MPPSRIQITEDGDLHFEKIIHKIGISRSVLDSSVYPRHGKNYTDEGEYRCVVKSAIGVVFSPVITVSVAGMYTYHHYFYRYLLHPTPTGQRGSF